VILTIEKHAELLIERIYDLLETNLIIYYEETSEETFKEMLVKDVILQLEDIIRDAKQT